MYRLFRFILISVACVAIFYSFTFGQNSRESKTYKIRAFGSTVGEMKITKTTLDELEIFEAESRVTLSYLIRKSERYNFSRSTYYNGRFRDSYLKNEENSEVLDYTAISSQNGHYLIQTHNRKSQCDGPITFTTTRMLFEEPVNVGSQIFSEYRGVYAYIRSPEPGIYHLKYPNGDSFTYKYKNGKLIEIETPQFIGKIRIVLEQ